MHKYIISVATQKQNNSTKHTINKKEKSKLTAALHSWRRQELP